ncbi:hypothetical protein HPB50_015528 [Hyalomma asiaticum]|uniref:Uncharacterized protein n=1 Tax=Hyalomma asiaticum TaxID=266040 RepID=A0ACB7RLK2_HYAAI|nr:hypothetical protein HPB50_015528 [Hyalomma asiaticum]
MVPQASSRREGPRATTTQAGPRRRPHAGRDEKMAFPTTPCGTPAGKAILARVGTTSPLTKERAAPLPDTVRSVIMVHPLPRNMHRAYNQARRRVRAKAFLSQLTSRRENALFVDASPSGPNIFVAAVVDMSGRIKSAAAIRTRSIGVAEQVAISLALTTKDPSPIFSESMTATRSFPSPATMAVYPDISPKCSECDQLATFSHLMWRCPRLRISTRKHHVNDREFLHCITSPNLANQLRAVQGACEAIGNLWFPAPPRVMPPAGS